MKIICLGPKETYSHLAAIKYCSNAEFYFVKSIYEGFLEFKKGKYDLFIAPVENMIYGTIRETLDGIFENNLKICDAVILPINHCLLAKDKKIKKIYSHPQALAQCEKFLQKNYPKADLIPCSSTSDACNFALKNKNSAAIASKNCLKENPSLKIIKKDIADYKNNQTKFFCISDSFSLLNKKFTSIALIPSEDSSGLLYKILKIFKKFKINLSKIESRPIKQKLGKYIFFIDFEGDFRQKKIEKALNKLKNAKFIKKLKILGSY